MTSSYGQGRTHLEAHQRSRDPVDGELELHWGPLLPTALWTSSSWSLLLPLHGRTLETLIASGTLLLPQAHGEA